MRSYHLESDLVSLDVIAQGGHLDGVCFQLGGGAVASPYSRPPWEPTDHPDAPPLLRILRGDFFCFPFGESEGVSLPHGEAPNREWKLEDKGPDKVRLSMELSEMSGMIERRIELRPGQRVLYQEHTVRGVSGTFNYGHHPILHMPEGITCPVRVSPFKFGSVYPGGFADPAVGERSALRAGARFESLHEVPLEREGLTSLAHYPARAGHEDLVMVSAADGPLAWTAVTFPGYVWVSLRSVSQFPSTLFWLSNGGRPQDPWSGRHNRRIGIEDVCSHFHDGAHISRQDLLKDEGIRTSRRFEPDEAVVLRHAQFVHPVEGQPPLANIAYDDPADLVRLIFEAGQEESAPLNWQWLLEPDER